MLRAAVALLGQDCALCGDRSGVSLVCGACEGALPRAGDFEEGIAPFEYRFPVDRLVGRFKFAGDLALGRWLALQLAQRVRDEARPDLLVAPPLGAAHLRARGFNQALEVAKAVGRELGVRVAIGGLAKVRETPPQSGLGLRERRSNLRGAFRCDLVLDGKHVAIVDDVVTTGATVAAVGQALQARGAARVSAWALARTPPS